MPTKPRGEGEPPINSTVEANLPKAPPKDAATPPLFDREFRQATASFMRGVEERLRSPNQRFDGKSEMDDPILNKNQQLEGLLEESTRELNVLSKNTEKQKIPADYAFGAAMIARDFSDSSHFFSSGEGRAADKAKRDAMRLAFAEGKTRLLATGEKIWPELKAKPDKAKPFAKFDKTISAVENFVEEPDRLHNLSKYLTNEFVKPVGTDADLRIPELKRASSLLYDLDEIIEDVGQYVGMETLSTYDFSHENIGALKAEEKVARRETIAVAMRGLCELIQIRDLIDVEYNGGGYAHPPEEVKQIDVARARAEQVAGGTASGAMTEEELSRSKAEMDRLWASSQAKQKAKKAESSTAPKVESPGVQTAFVNFAKDPRFAALYDQKNKTVDDMKRVVTEEMKQALLGHMLAGIDTAIQDAKQYAAQYPGEILGKKGMALVFGSTVKSGESAPAYQKIAVAAGGSVISPDKIASMPVVEYLKTFLGYDLEADSVRAEPLKKLTDMFYK